VIEEPVNDPANFKILSKIMLDMCFAFQINPTTFTMLSYHIPEATEEAILEKWWALVS